MPLNLPQGTCDWCPDFASWTPQAGAADSPAAAVSLETNSTHTISIDLSLIGVPKGSQVKVICIRHDCLARAARWSYRVNFVGNHGLLPFRFAMCGHGRTKRRSPTPSAVLSAVTAQSCYRCVLDVRTSPDRRTWPSDAPGILPLWPFKASVEQFFWFAAQHGQWRSDRLQALGFSRVKVKVGRPFWWLATTLCDKHVGPSLLRETRLVESFLLTIIMYNYPTS